ncbi:MAG: hypothetical protein BroJett011_00010 [Chloroflexota bacterium]|nr:MAG: hypothetical protein BroJett011_00010 [Chloroflexota bacterium]
MTPPAKEPSMASKSRAVKPIVKSLTEKDGFWFISRFLLGALVLIQYSYCALRVPFTDYATRNTSLKKGAID